MNLRCLLIPLLTGLGCFMHVSAKVYDITRYGAKGDSTTLNTKAIQRTIDECAANGGGTVYFPAGVYLSGTLILRDNIHLFFESGSVLIASTDVTQFPLQQSKMISLRPDNYSLIYAEQKNNITISGNGRIIGQGDKAPYHIYHKDQYANIIRPKIICLIECVNVKVKDITLENSPSWVQHYLGCENVLIEGITVISRYSSVNNDGIDIDCCKNVRISDCFVNSEDDAIVLKSTSDRLCENITISNCVLTSHCNALKCGTESNGGFRNITVSNCVIYDTYLSGIALEIVDGGIMELVNINNIAMYRVNNPIFIKLGDRARPYAENMLPPNMGEIRNIQISNIQANEIGEYAENPFPEFSHRKARPKAAAVFIDGLPERSIKSISLQNIEIHFKGGGERKDGLIDVPIYPKVYPEYTSYGDIRPAYGFYCRFINNLRLKDVQVDFEKPDYRPSFIFENIDKLYLQNIEGEKADGNQPVVIVKKSNAYVELDPLSVKRNDISADSSSKLVIK